MSEATRLVTAEELERFHGDDDRYELVAGRVVRMSPAGFRHGTIVAQLLFLLKQHLHRHPLGVAVTEVGFKLASNPDSVRAPDVAFIRRGRIPSPAPVGFWHGPPDLAAEVLSPDDRPSEVRTKIEEYLTSGVPVVLVVDPDHAVVFVHRRTAPVLQLTADDILDPGDVIPGFRCRVRDIFE